MATASQSLINMTVASDNAGGNQGLLMPKLQYRFRVNFLNFGTTQGGIALTKQVVDCSRPQVQFPEITLPVYNSTLYLAGKYAWQPMTVNIRDDATGAVAQQVGQQVQKQLDFYEQASAATGQDYKFQTNIEVLDGGNGQFTPVILERWELYGCFIQNVNYNTLNYGTNDVVTISLTLRFDNAVQLATPGTIPTGDGDRGIVTGVGVDIGRSLAGDSVTSP